MKTELKCGEIFRCGPGKFIFSCTYCGEQFNCNSSALSHIETHFLTNLLININKQESPVAVQIRNDELFNPLAMHKQECEINIKQEPQLNMDDVESIIFSPTSSGALLSESQQFNFNVKNAASTTQVVTNQIASTIKTTKRKPNRVKYLRIFSHWGPEMVCKTVIECDICGRSFQKKHAYRHFVQHQQKIKREPPPKRRYKSILSLPTPSAIIADANTKPQTILVPTGRRTGKEWGPTMLENSVVECDMCGRRMQKRCSHLHFRTHTNPNAFQCTVCHKRYHTASARKKHMRIHLGIKKYSCHICGRQFHDGTNLQMHIRTHTGEKPYKCTICEKSFAQSAGLTIHRRFHTFEKPYSCALCGQTFFTNSSWNDHMRRHANDKRHKCSYCDMLFYKIGALKRHERGRHTGERPFKCEVCPQTFTSRNTYRQHYILHTGAKPYKCRVCDLTFAQGAGRRSHERSVHKDVADLIAKPTKSLARFSIIEIENAAGKKRNTATSAPA